MSTVQRAPRSSLALWLPVAIIGWAGFALIALQLASLDPSRLGDDLRLLVDAGTRWREGAPLYTPVPPGTTLDAASLFFSYPPVIAQAMALVAGIPFAAIFVAWAAGAVCGLWLVAQRLGRDGRAVAWPALALAPYIYPLAVSLLLGNLNAWFPVAFGLVLAAAVAGGLAAPIAGGAALAIASLAKLHPASLGLWLLVRGFREGRPGRSHSALAVAAVVGLGLLTAGVALGGIGPWADYLAFLRGGAGTADLVSPLNVGPASQLAQLLGLPDATARGLQAGVSVIALAGTVAAARLLDDPVESFGWATVASLVVLPVTWFHYPVALLPVALAAASRAGGEARRRAVLLLGAAIVTATLAILAPVVVWAAAALVLAAARASRTARAETHP